MLKMVGWFTAIVLLLVYATSSMTQAASIRIVGDTILYDGTVQKNDVKVIRGMVEVSGIKRISLNSPGGVAMTGYALGYLFRELEMSVVVPKGNYCLSACATAFLGGKEKTLEGTLGFHVAWSRQKGEYSNGMKAGQRLGAIDAVYHFEMGYTMQMQYVVSVVTDSENFLLLSAEDLDFLSFDVPEDFTRFNKLEDQWLSSRISGPLRTYFIIEGV